MVLKPPVRIEILSFFRFLPPLKTKFARRRSQPSTSGDAVDATDVLITWKIKTRRRFQFFRPWNYPESQRATRRGAATVLVTGDAKGWIGWTPPDEIKSRATGWQSRPRPSFILLASNQATRQRLWNRIGAVLMKKQGAIFRSMRRQLLKWSWVENIQNDREMRAERDPPTANINTVDPWLNEDHQASKKDA